MSTTTRSKIFNLWIDNTRSKAIALFYIDYIFGGPMIDFRAEIINELKTKYKVILTLQDSTTICSHGNDRVQDGNGNPGANEFCILEIPMRAYKTIVLGDASKLREDSSTHKFGNLKHILREPYDTTTINRYYYISIIIADTINTPLYKKFIGDCFDITINSFTKISSLCINQLGVCISKLAFGSSDFYKKNYYNPMYALAYEEREGWIGAGGIGSKKLTRKKNNAKNLQGKKYTRKTNINQNMLYYQEGGDDLKTIANTNVVDLYRVAIHKKVYTNNTIILTAGTGLGKTTRVPIFLLEILTKPGRDNNLKIRLINPNEVKPEEDWQTSNPENIMIPDIDENSMVLCALPKVTLVKAINENLPILSAVADNSIPKSPKPKTVAECNSYNSERIIGTLLADKRDQNPGTYLNFITSGLLLKLMESDPYLEYFRVDNKMHKISCVIIDEAHERTSEIDRLLILMKRLLLVRPNFKLVIMSATINACIFKEYFYGEKVPYGEGEGDTCDEINQKTFARAYPNHYNSDVPILHIDTEGDKSWKIEPKRATPKIGGDVGFKVDVYYLPEAYVLCNNLTTAAKLILQIVKHEIAKATILPDLDIPFILPDLDTPVNLSTIFKSDKENIDKKNKDIIVFVPEKSVVRIIWSYLYMFKVQDFYDVVFYSKSNKVRIGRRAKLNMDFAPEDKDLEKFTDEYPERMYISDKDKLSSHVIEDKDAEYVMPLLIFATNVVESSITFEHIKYVIDFGNNKYSDHLSSMNMDTLTIQSINKASADQRKGRTGRRCNGICFRLYTEEMYNSFKPSKESDLLHKRLDSSFLSLLEKYNFLNLDYIETPSQNQIEVLLFRLKKMGYITEKFDIYSRHDDEECVNVPMLKWISGMKQFIKYTNQESVETEYIDLDVMLLSILYKTQISGVVNVDDVIFIIWAMFMINKATGGAGRGSIGQMLTPPKKSEDDFDSNKNYSCTLLWLYHHSNFLGDKGVSEWKMYYANSSALKNYLLSNAPKSTKASSGAPTPAPEVSKLIPSDVLVKSTLRPSAVIFKPKVLAPAPPTPAPPTPAPGSSSQEALLLTINVSKELINNMNSILQEIGQVCEFGKKKVKKDDLDVEIKFDPFIHYTEERNTANYTYLYCHYSTVFNFLFLTKIPKIPP